MTSSFSVARSVLYYSPESVWSTAGKVIMHNIPLSDTSRLDIPSVLIALHEKGYGEDEVDKRLVALSKGEEFSPSFLRLNPKATVPTLVAPLEGSLGPDTETRFKALSDPTAIVLLLDKSRSVASRTSTTSTAPAPSLSPATVAFSSLSTRLVHAVHANTVCPDKLLHHNARDLEALRRLGVALVPVLQSRCDAIARHLSDSENGAIHVSEKTKSFWRDQKKAIETLLETFVQNNDEARQHYFDVAKETWEAAVPNTLTAINREMIGPYSLGEHVSVADIHVGVWLAQVIELSGGSLEENGEEAILKVERHIGCGFTLPKDFAYTPASGDKPQKRSKLSVFWDTMKGRASWQKVYGSSTSMTRSD